MSLFITNLYHTMYSILNIEMPIITSLPIVSCFFFYEIILSPFLLLSKHLLFIKDITYSFPFLSDAECFPTDYDLPFES